MLTKADFDCLVELHEQLTKYSWFEKCEVYNVEQLIFSISQSVQHLMSIFGKRVVKEGNLYTVQFSACVKIVCVEDNDDTSFKKSDFEDAVSIVDLGFSPFYPNFTIGRHYLYFKEFENYDDGNMEDMGEVMAYIEHILDVDVSIMNRYFSAIYKGLYIYF